MFMAGVYAVGLGGCGGSSKAHVSHRALALTTITNTQPVRVDPPLKEKVPTIDIPMSSSARLRPVAKRYTCDGADIHPPIKWGPVPANTVETALFIIGYQASLQGKPASAWAVTGLSPKLHQLAAGQLPAGAIIGRNQFGKNAYSICPPRNSSEQYVIQIDPLPHTIPAKQGFNPETLANQAVTAAEHEGQLPLTYKR